MTGLTEVLAGHSARGVMNQGMSFDGCTCGAILDSYIGHDGFPDHLAAVVTEWPTSDGMAEAVTQAALSYVSYYDDGFPVEAARATLAALAEHVKGGAS